MVQQVLTSEKLFPTGLNMKLSLVSKEGVTYKLRVVLASVLQIVFNC